MYFYDFFTFNKFTSPNNISKQNKAIQNKVKRLATFNS